MAQTAHTLETEIAKAIRLDYLLHLPRDYGADAGRKWPLILFLHGAGERGIELQAVKKHGIPRITEEREDFPFITVSPQCPPHSMWMLEREALIALLDTIVDRYAVDAQRIYLTGLSMGGYGTWDLGLAYPERFAALAPICGGVMWFRDFVEQAQVLAHTPIWVFHGAKDDVVPLAESENAVRALRAYGSQVRFTVYPEARHDSWTATYSNPELYEWFLSHSR
jgi:predicted peptidase